MSASKIRKFNSMLSIMNDTISSQGVVLSNSFGDIIRRYPIIPNSANKATNLENMLNSIALLFSFVFVKQSDQYLFQNQQSNQIYQNIMKMNMEDFEKILIFLSREDFIASIVNMQSELNASNSDDENYILKIDIFLEKMNDSCFSNLRILSKDNQRGFGAIVERITNSINSEGTTNDDDTFQDDVNTYMIDLLVMYILGSLIKDIMFQETRDIDSKINMLKWFDEVLKIFENSDKNVIEAKQDVVSNSETNQTTFPKIPKIDNIKVEDDKATNIESNVNQILVKLSLGSLLSYLMYKVIKNQ